MKKLKRVVTFLTHGDLGGSPHEILTKGSRIIQLPRKHRVFVVRKVCYDDDLTPLYSEPTPYERTYIAMDDLEKDNPGIDTLILDADNQYRPYEICAEQ